MLPFNLAQDRWAVENEDWHHFSKDWRSKTMASVLEEKTIHVQTYDVDMHFIVLDVYRSLFRKLLKHQQLGPRIGVLMTGQPGTG